MSALEDMRELAINHEDEYPEGLVEELTEAIKLADINPRIIISVWDKIILPDGSEATVTSILRSEEYGWPMDRVYWIQTVGSRTVTGRHYLADVTLSTKRS